MQTVEALRRQIAVAEGLHAVVRTMKVLAAASIRQYEEAVEALGRYDHTIALGFQIALRQPARPVAAVATTTTQAGPTGVVLFGSGQGLCGRFNEQIVTYAGARLHAQAVNVEHLLLVGEHAMAPPHLAGVPAVRHPVPSSIAGITPAVQELAQALEVWRSEQGVERILLFHNRLRPGTGYEPHLQQLFPLDEDWLLRLQRKPWPTRTLPAFSMDRGRLFAALVRQYLFVLIYRALAESLASEQASRLTAMQAAEKNIDERLEQLQNQYRQQRQQVVTEEVLDILAAFEARVPDGTY